MQVSVASEETAKVLLLVHAPVADVKDVLARIRRIRELIFRVAIDDLRDVANGRLIGWSCCMKGSGENRRAARSRSVTFRGLLGVQLACS